MLTLNVVCAQPTRFALVFRGPTSSEKHGFSTNDGKAMFSIVLAQAQADGKPVTWTHSGDPNKNKQRIHLTPDKEVQPLTAGQVTVSPISRLTALVEIDTTMRAEDTTKLASDMVFSEQGTFHIVPS